MGTEIHVPFHSVDLSQLPDEMGALTKLLKKHGAVLRENFDEACNCKYKIVCPSETYDAMKKATEKAVDYKCR
jgi:hypothetical protein